MVRPAMRCTSKFWLTFALAYNAFTRYGRSSSWCKSHALSFRALSRAVSIRSQLKKYMQRFGLAIESCQGDAKRLRQCLVSGYWRNGARWMADGTYRSVRGNVVSNCYPLLGHTSGMLIICWTGTSCTPELCAVHQETEVGLGGFSRDGRNQEDSVCDFICSSIIIINLVYRIRILTEIEPDWLLEYGHKYHDKRTGAGVSVG